MFLYVLVEDIKNNLKLFNNTHVFWTEYFKYFKDIWFTSRNAKFKDTANG